MADGVATLKNNPNHDPNIKSLQMATQIFVIQIRFFKYINAFYNKGYINSKQRNGELTC